MAVQICTVRYVGRFLGEDPLAVPRPNRRSIPAPTRRIPISPTSPNASPSPSPPSPPRTPRFPNPSRPPPPEAGQAERRPGGGPPDRLSNLGSGARRRSGAPDGLRALPSVHGLQVSVARLHATHISAPVGKARRWQRPLTRGESRPQGLESSP
ncbi:hypothetical protein ACGFYQ_38220 [Streptomyces sp. NPDC048258]|uniref:hypothetical protein n=1 Tax=Streptomyces sp. NPDC048258 TaxID=3365527 RepID=UPI00371DFD0B